MKISSRFTLDILFVIGGAFLVATALTFSAPIAGWIAFGVSVGLMLAAIASVAITRSTGRRIGHGLIGMVALWSLIAALTFSGTVLTWLVFANAIMLGFVALGDLTAHEVTSESVVHRLEVTTTPADLAHRTNA